jgi:hypothetical protein
MLAPFRLPAVIELVSAPQGGRMEKDAAGP